ncbi:hypothetical protein ZHAS_00013582 [Anopheles sinensis]|uniref:Uncharacterized protein n=1 Tax=Anopheles sinensis TaxID=74873 RepID=A0A084W5U9_ANOSI|nr:hypothetical protein ZHAS_00013582 [Anopheles sinensis]
MCSGRIRCTVVSRLLVHTQITTDFGDVPGWHTVATVDRLAVLCFTQFDLPAKSGDGVTA